MASQLKKPQPGTFLFPRSVGVTRGYLFEARLLVHGMRRLCPPLMPADVVRVTIKMALCDLVQRFLPRNFEKEHLHALMRFAVGIFILAEGRLAHDVGLIPMLSMPDDMAAEKAVRWYLAWEQESHAVLMRALERARRGEALTPREHLLRIIGHTAPSPFKDIATAVSMVDKLNVRLGREPEQLPSGERERMEEQERRRLRAEADILDLINDANPFELLFMAKDGITLGQRQVRQRLMREQREALKTLSLDAPVTGRDGDPTILGGITPAEPEPDALHLADRARLAREAREAYEERARQARRPSAEAHVLDNLLALVQGELTSQQLAERAGMDVSSINKALKGIKEEFHANPRFRAWRELFA